MSDNQAELRQHGWAARTSLLSRLQITVVDAGVLTLVWLLIIVFAPPLFLAGWTPRIALVVSVVPIGIVLLAQLSLARDRAALLLTAALGWTVLSGLVSPAPRSALLGFAGRDLSALAVVGAGCCWALGRSLSPRGRQLIPELVVWSTALCALVGVLQVVADVERGSLALAFGRPTGFVTNPVYFGALCACGLVGSVALWSHSVWVRLAVPLVVLGIGTSLSGSRVALLAAVVSLVALLAVRRDRAAFLGATLGAFSLGVGVLLDRDVGSGRNAADRLIDDGGRASGDGRFTIWRYGVDAWLERPLLGHGFGRFRPAVQGDFSVGFVRTHAPNEVTQPWFDPHNIAITVIVAVGLIGAVLFATWSATWLAGARGLGLWLLLPLVLHWALQPVSLFTLPLAMLIFASAGDANREPISVTDVPPPVLRGALALGVLCGCGLVVGDVAFRHAVTTANPGRMATIASIAGDDPILSDVVARAYEFEGEAGSDRSIEWRERAADTEPDRPYWWSQLAEALRRDGRIEEAEVALDRAFKLQEYNRGSQRVEVLLALGQEDEVRLRAALGLACELGQSDCSIDAAQLIKDRREALGLPAENG